MSESPNGECPHCHQPIESDWRMYQQGSRHHLTLTAQEVKHGITDGYPLAFHGGRVYRFLECLEGNKAQRFWQCPGSAKQEADIKASIWPRGEP